MDKKGQGSPEQGQAGNRKFRMRPQVLPVVDALAEEWATDATEVINRLVVESLQRIGRWPAKRAGESAA